MATWNIVTYYNNSSNQPLRYLSARVINYDTNGSTESYRIITSGFNINVSMVRVLSTGYCQMRWTIDSVNNEANYNRLIFTYRSYGRCYTSNEIEFVIGDEYEYLAEYMLSTASYYNDIELNWLFFDYKRMDAWELGYNYGFDDASSLYNTNNKDFNGTFTLIGSAFSSLAGIMNTQVIGGLTIGGLIGIPLTITILLTLFKMMRK